MKYYISFHDKTQFKCQINDLPNFILINYTAKLSPQPHVLVAFGFTN